ncbi:MAG: response regulator [Fibrobacterota bacterium]|nr:response regulator [Fibrobacterota bacterium]QQS03549.1 MAG: response regulator [Fibrobacterota bacterium]
MSRRILVIEDESSIRENIREMLEAEGFEITEAADGTEGVRKSVEHAPDLVVCDVNMPGMDGFQVLASLRASTDTLHVPFLFLTARADRTSLRRGMELGAEDYLTKPFSRQELLAAVGTRLSRSESLAATYRNQLGALRNTLARALPHELLTPLNGILGLSGILVEEYETVRRGEMLDIARGISHSGEALHRLVHRFLAYAELEMAILDSSLRDRIANTVCTDAPGVCARALELTVFPFDAAIQILDDHLEMLLQELSGISGPFESCAVSQSDGFWRILLRSAPQTEHRRLPMDASSLSSSLVKAIATIYGAKLTNLDDNSLVVSIPLAKKP